MRGSLQTWEASALARLPRVAPGPPEGTRPARPGWLESRTSLEDPLSLGRGIVGVQVGAGLRRVFPRPYLVALGTWLAGLVLFLILVAHKTHRAGLSHGGKSRFHVAARTGAPEVGGERVGSRRRGLVATHAPGIGTMVVIVARGAGRTGRQRGATLVAGHAILRFMPAVVERESTRSRRRPHTQVHGLLHVSQAAGVVTAGARGLPLRAVVTGHAFPLGQVRPCRLVAGGVTLDARQPPVGSVSGNPLVAIRAGDLLVGSVREAWAASGPAHLIGQERPPYRLHVFFSGLRSSGHGGLDVAGLLRRGFATARHEEYDSK